ncbi:MAG TPA: S49 family peptidase [Phycisphaerae bacterium]|nr:S49 family peptidase [Phycisphaerae bacterium]HUX16782.1 S49 family peptidase [Phycisphaerae bacterium]
MNPTGIAPAINSLMSSIWALEPGAFDALIADLSTIRSQGRENDTKEETGYSVEDGVAKISVAGILLKSRHWLLDYFRIAQTGYDEIRANLAKAATDSAVNKIELVIDSPGGTVAGGEETAAAIKAASAVKPITATVQDLAASGAYWLASQTGHIRANENAQVGSIGVYAIASDYSRRAEEMGIKVNVLRSGEHKGVGVVGAAITESHLAALQTIVDGLADHFIGAVASGRRMAKAEAARLATGQTWLAAEARELGLIDEVATDATAVALTSDIAEDMKGVDMAEKTGEQVADSSALAEQITGLEAEKKTLTEANAALEAKLKEISEKASADAEALTASTKAVSDLTAKVQDLEKRVTTLSEGADPVPAGKSPEDAAGEDFLTRARSMAKEEKSTVSAAMRKLAREEPDLYKAYQDKLRR